MPFLLAFLALGVAATAAPPSPEFVIQTWHEAGSLSKGDVAGLSPDGTLLMTLSDRSLMLWEVQSGQLLQTIALSPEKKPSYLTFVASNRVVLARGWDAGSATRTWDFGWDVASGRPLTSDEATVFARQVPEEHFVPSSPGVKIEDGELVVTQGERVHRVPYAGAYANTWTVQMTLSPDGRTVVLSPSGQWSNDPIEVWDVDKGLIRSFEQSGRAFFSPDGWTFAPQSVQPNAVLFDLHTRTIVRVFGTHTAPVQDLAISGDGRLVATADLHAVRVWDRATARATTYSEPGCWVRVAMNAQGKLAAVRDDSYFGATGMKALVVWDLKTRRELGQTPLGETPLGLSFTPSGDLIVVTSGTLDDARRWHSEVLLLDGKTLTTKQRFTTFGDESLFTWPAVTPDGGTVVTFAHEGSGPEFGTLLFHEVATGHVTREIEVSGRPLLARAALSADGSLIAAGESSGSGTQVFDVKTGKQVGAISQGVPLTFTPDGQQVLVHVGGLDGSDLELYTIAGQKKATFSGFSGLPTAARFTPDGAYLLAASKDRTIREWNARTGELLATFVGVDTADFVITLPSGAYTASPNAHAGVGFRLGARALPFEQFDLRLNRPDLVVARLGMGKPELVQALHRAYVKRLHRMGFTEEQLVADAQLPELTLLSERPPLATSAAQLDLRVRATSHAVDLDRLQVLVNDVPLWGSGGFSLRDRKTRDVELPVSIELSHGRNKIQLYAIDAHGSESLRESFEVEREGTVRPTLYLVTIGISDYVDASYRLSYASKDAADLAALVQSRAKGFAEVKVLKLLDRDAVREKIEGAKDFLQQASVDDYAIVFAAGHGLLDEKLDYWFATADLDFAHPEQRGLAYDRIEWLLDGIKARRKLLLMDTCNSGELDKDESQLVASADTVAAGVKSRAVRGIKAVHRGAGLQDNAQMMQQVFSDLRRGSGAVVIASASGLEFALESSDWKNGLFTYALIDGLRSGAADHDHDGVVRVSELRDYVVTRVQQLSGGRQTPTVRREDLEFDYPVLGAAKLNSSSCNSSGLPAGALLLLAALALRKHQRRRRSE